MDQVDPAPQVHRFDSALGRWTLHEWRPPRLAPWLDLLWLSDGHTAFPRKRIFPNGRLELIVNLGDPMRLVLGAGPALFVGGTLSGVHSGPIEIEMKTHHRTLGVRLRPAGALALLGRGVVEVSDWTVALDALVGAAARELADRCHAAVTPDECLRRAARWLRARLVAGRAMDPAVAWSAMQIEASGGAASITALQAESGISRTRFAAAFREQMGVSAKRYARIFRFRRALDLLHATTDDLGEVALRAGYYDQPHMNAEFRALGGLAPGAFRAAPRYAGTLSVATGDPAAEAIAAR